MKKIIIQAGKGVIAGYVLTLVNIFRKLIIIPIVLGFVGQSLYGIWLIIGEVMGYLRQAEGGMGFAIEQRIAAVKWENNLSKLNTILSNGVMIYFLLSILAIIIGFCLTPFFVTIFKIEPEHHSLVTLVFLLTVVSMGLGLPLDVISSFLRGVQKQAWATSIAIVGTIIGFFIVLLLLYNSLGLLALPISGLIVLTFRYGLSWYLLKRAEKGISISIRYIKKKIAKDLLGFSFFAFVNQISYIIVFCTDSIVIGYFLGSGRVTIYVLTFQLTLTLIGVVRGISNHLQPGFAEISSLQKIDQLRILFTSSLRVLMVFSWLVAVAVFFMNSHFVELWVGQENFGGQALTVIFTLIGIYIIFRQHCSSLMLSTGEVRFVAKWVGLEAFLNLFLSLILVNYLGLLGVALGTLFAGVIASIIILIPKVIQKIEISSRLVMNLILWRPIIFSVPTATTFWFLTNYIFRSVSWQSLLITGLVSGCVGLVSIWYNIDIQYRQSIIQKVNSSFISVSDNTTKKRTL